MKGNFIEEQKKKTTDEWKGGIVDVDIYDEILNCFWPATF
jgi:hypothetical protein